MTINTKIGSFNTGTGGATTTVAVTDVGFTPKALYVVDEIHHDRNNGRDHRRKHGAVGFGFVTAAARNLCYVQWEDNSATGDNDTRWYNDACVAILTIAGAVDGPSSISNPLTPAVLHWWWMTMFAASYHISYLAIGGDASVEVATGTTTTPAATGNSSNTDPELFAEPVIHVGRSWHNIGCARSTQPNSVLRAGESNQGVSGVNGRNVTPIDAYSYSYGSECLGMPENYTNGMAERAAFVSFDALGFTLNFLETVQHEHLWMACIKGGAARVENLTTRTDGTTSRKQVSGFPRRR